MPARLNTRSKKTFFFPLSPDLNQILFYLLDLNIIFFANPAKFIENRSSIRLRRVLAHVEQVERVQI